MKHLLIIGSGGHGRSSIEVALQAGTFESFSFIDDASDKINNVFGYPVLGTTENLVRYHKISDVAFVAIGNNTLRKKLCTQLQSAGFKLATLIHPRAVVSPRAEIGQGSVIMAGAIINTEAKLGTGVIINSGAVVDHHAQVHDFCHLGVNACMAGSSILGEGAWMQAGCALGYGVRVEANTVLMPGTALPKVVS